MMKRGRPVRLLILLTLLSIPLGAFAADPFMTSINVVPATLSEPRPVVVTVEVRNASEETISATLYDPADQVCTSFGSGGTALMEPGASQRFTGTYTVTESQLEAGRLAYSLRYAFTSQSGEHVAATMPISARLTYEGAAPAEEGAYPVTAESAVLEVQQETTTDMMVQTGKSFTLAFRLVNRGSQTIDTILLEDPGILASPVSRGPLAPGEETMIGYQVTMDGVTIQSRPVVTYGAGGASQTLKLQTVRLHPVFPLTVSLASDAQTVRPGTRLTLHYGLFNGSDKTYTLTVREQTMGDVKSGITLRPGERYEGDFAMVMNQTSDLRLSVTGKDDTGAPVAVQSNTLTCYVSNAG